MQELYEDIRRDAEKQGHSMTDEKFIELVQYAERKAKLIYDALNGVAWYDDNAIVDGGIEMFKREKRMHSFIIRAQEILAEGKREESAKMVIQGLQHYSNKIIGAIQPYSKADATLLVIALRYLADQVEQKNGCALAVKALSKTIEFPELEEVEKVRKATEGL